MTIALLYHLQCDKARIQICGRLVDCHIFDDKTALGARGGEVTDFGFPLAAPSASLIEGMAWRRAKSPVPSIATTAAKCFKLPLRARSKH